MMALRKICVGVAVSLAASTCVFAQGVPIIDASDLLKNLEILTHQETDKAIQTEKKSTRAEIEKVEREQLVELDKILASFTMSESVETTVKELEDGADGAKSAEEVYPPEDNTEAGKIMFGDAKLTVEQIIIQAAKDTHSHAGVSTAGLSQVQWRALLQAMIWQESRFNPNAESPVGAYGLTQIMPATGRDLGIPDIKKATPYTQAERGATYLAQQLKRFNGNIVHALAAYNAGAGNVNKHGGVPPFKETQHYVVVIPNKYNEYLAKVGGIDALGTIEPGLAAAANTAMMANGSAGYANQTNNEIKEIAARIRSIIERIKTTSDVTESMSLNSYAKAELVRLLALYTRTRAANSQQMSAEAIELAVDQALASQFLSFGE